MKNRIKVEIMVATSQSALKKGDIGYIDGYVRGADDIPYAVVIVGERIGMVRIRFLKVLS